MTTNHKIEIIIMKPKYRNLFFLFGVLAIVIMLLTFKMDYDELWRNISKAGYWFIAVMATWVVVYFFSTVSWRFLIKGGDKKCPVGFWKLYKLSVSGFALNYATPCGLLGGEPYRIMELTPYVGVERATSSVLLYLMMHVFSHISFWLSTIILYVFTRHVTVPIGILLVCAGAFCCLAIYFFMKGYRNGMVVKIFTFLQKVPFVKGWAARFYAEKKESLSRIDSQIAELHRHRKSTFYASYFFEFLSRTLMGVEIFFILKILTPHVNLLDCMFIISFTSLFANIFFFSPMQLGAREGGFAMAVSGLALSGAFGVYTSLIARVRELLWIVIGVLLMKVGNKKPDAKLDVSDGNN